MPPIVQPASKSRSRSPRPPPAPTCRRRTGMPGTDSSRCPAAGGVAGDHRAQLVRIERPVVRRHRVVRRALEDVQALRLARDLRHRLDRRRPGADEPDPQAGEVDAVMGPLGGLVPGPRNVSRPAKSGRLTEDRLPTASTQIGAVIRSPRSVTSVQRSASSSYTASVISGPELDVAAQVEPVGDVLEVAQDLGLRRVPLASTPSRPAARGRTRRRSRCSRRRTARRDSGSSTTCRRRRRRARRHAARSPSSRRRWSRYSPENPAPTITTSSSRGSVCRTAAIGPASVPSGGGSGRSGEAPVEAPRRCGLRRSPPRDPAVRSRCPRRG